MTSLLPSIRPQDILDIIIMSFLVYQLYSWFRNSKALQVLIGLAFLGLLFFGTKTFGLFMTSWILQELGTVLFILIIVLFQTEIRQALYRFSLMRNFIGKNGPSSLFDFLDASLVLFKLAETRTGAIVIFQRQESVEEHVVHGVPLDSLMCGELLKCIFHPSSPLHDGAVVVRNGRIAAASVHLPLSGSTDIPQYFGTRHRAGLGLSECSDAVVVIVSEERGVVSVAMDGVVEEVASAEALAELLRRHLSPQVDKQGFRSGLRPILFRDLRTKLAVFCVVALSWAVITGRQGEIVTVTAPVRFQNLPENLTLLKASPEEVDVQLKVFSTLLPSAKRLDIAADIDLSRIRQGKNSVSVRNEDFSLPMGVVISAVDPSTLKVVADKKVRKTLRVEARTVGSPGSRYRLRGVKVTPVAVVAEGPESVLSDIEKVYTEEVDLSEHAQGEVLDRKVASPAPSVKIVGTDSVRIAILGTRR